MEKSPSLRVIAVAFNPGDELEAMLVSLAEACSEPYEIVICDNGTQSEAVDDAQARFGARIIRPGRNLGYGRAVNLAAEGFQGQWLLIVNPDVVFKPGCVDTLVAETAFWPRGAAFGPRILTVDGELYPSARRFPALVSGAGHAMLGNIWPGNPFTRRYRGENRAGHSRRTDWLSGACVLVRREAFREIGGFDERYFMFFEDTQLGRDFRTARWRSVYVPNAVAVHDQGTSWRERPEEMIRAHHESAIAYMEGIYSKRWQAPVRWAVRGALHLRKRIEVRLVRGGG